MVPSYHTTDWSQAKKVTDDNYSWTTRVSGLVFLVEHTNSGGPQNVLNDFAKGGRCKGLSKTPEKEKQASTFFGVEASK